MKNTEYHTESVKLIEKMTNTLQQVRELIEKKIEINRDEVYMEGKETSYTEYEYQILNELLGEIDSLPSEGIAVADTIIHPCNGYTCWRIINNTITK